MATTTKATPAPATALSLPEKFGKLKEVLAGELIERTTIIDTIVLALLSRKHHFQLGSPGVAKSLSIRRLVAHIGGLSDEDYFEILLTRFTGPEEVFGPLDILALQEGNYRFKPEGYLPTAKIAFTDEIFKANASILNAKLTIMNERLFRNDAKVEMVPLSSVFCASNELPEGEELNALYDRIHFRHIVRPIQEPGSFVNMLKMHGSAFDDEKVVTWEEIEQAQKEVLEVDVPDDVLEAIVKVKNDLRSEGIEPTDRRFKECIPIIQAAAWMDGEAMADIEHMRPLAHVLWTTPEEQPKVERMLLELANPLDKDAMTLLENVEKISSELDRVLSDKQMDQNLRNKKGVELHNKVERAKDELQKLMDQVDKSRRKSAKALEVKERLLSVTRRLLAELFNIKVPEDATQIP